MPAEVINSTKKLLDNRIPTLSHLIIQWFGGEPLLGYGTVIDIMDHINRRIIETNPNVALIGTMSTNGHLLNVEKLTALTTANVKKFQISFDGDKDVHDLMRVTAGGKGTFDAIWGNMLRAQNTNLDFSITLRLHVNKTNTESMRRLVKRVKNELYGDERFPLFIRLLSRQGSANEDNLPVSDDLKGVKELKEYAKSLGLGLFGLDIYQKVPEYVCYAAKPYSFILRADGSISKCTVSLYDDHNIVGKLNLDGTMTLDQAKVNRWSVGLFNGNKEDLACPQKGIRKELDILRVEDICPTTQKVKLRVI
jgi:uncharacterized protein